MKIGSATSIPTLPSYVPPVEPAKEAPVADVVDVREAEPAGPPPNTREVRVNRFFKTLSKESLDHLRYLSTIYACNIVGTTVGALAFTRLGIHLAHENPAVVGGVAIGGAVASGAIASLLGYLYEHHKDKQGPAPVSAMNRPGGLVDKALAGAALFKALPKFVYPTVYGANPAERKIIYDALDKLPLKDVTAAQTMTVIPGLGDTGIGGMSQPLMGLNRIILDQANLNSPSFGPELVTHELGHAVDYSGGWGLLGSTNWQGGFGKGPFVSQYAAGNRFEDFAESYHAFHSDPTFKDKFPEKWKVLDQASRPTPPEMLVDHDPIRNAGKSIGEGLGAVPYLRTALELAGALIGPVMIRKGAVELSEGLDSGDPARKLQGKMNLSTGFLLSLPGGGPLAIGAVVGQQALIHWAGDDQKKLEKASDAANSVMALSTGPFGMAALAIGQELGKAGIDVTKIDFTQKEAEKAIGAGKMLKGLLATVGGAVGGSLAGVAIGTALSGPNGAALGALWGRIAGGLVGLSVYGAIQARKEENNTNSPYDLTKEDKKFLAKIVGGAALGAVGGTVAGTLGGQAVGAAVGGALGGDTGRLIGGWVGGATGTMVGAYQLGKVGAHLGHKWAGDAEQTLELPTQKSA